MKLNIEYTQERNNPSTEKLTGVSIELESALEVDWLAGVLGNTSFEDERKGLLGDYDAEEVRDVSIAGTHLYVKLKGLLVDDEWL